MKNLVYLFAQNTIFLMQILIAKLFEHWKIEGFQKHIAKTTHFYKSRRDAILFSANKWLQGKTLGVGH